MVNIQTTLQDIGLKENEIKVYLAALSLGSQPASVLWKKTGIARSNAQYICGNLVDRGLLSMVTMPTGNIYSPEKPEKIISMLGRQYDVLDKKIHQVQAIMGDLRNMMNPYASVPRVKYYTGLDGIIDMYEDVFKEGKTIYGALNMMEDVHPGFTQYLEREYIPKRVQSGIQARWVVTDNLSTREYRKNDEKMHKRTLLLPEDQYPFETCIHVYAGKVAFYSYSQQDMSGIIIQNEKMHDTMLSLLKASWDYARTLPVNSEYKHEELIVP